VATPRPLPEDAAVSASAERWAEFWRWLEEYFAREGVLVDTGWDMKYGFEWLEEKRREFFAEEEAEW